MNNPDTPVITREELIDGLYEVFNQYTDCSKDDLLNGKPLADVMDSLAVLEILFDIEDRFDLKIDDDSAMAIATFNDVVDEVHLLMSADSAQ